MDCWVMKRRKTDLSGEDEGRGIAGNEQTKIPVVQTSTNWFT